MNFSRILSIPAILLLATTTQGPILAQTSGGAPAPAAQQDLLKDGKVVEDIVARINDQIITESDFNRAQQEMESDLKQQNNETADDRQKDLLRDLIDQQLLLSKGKELNITGETELVRRLDEIRKQNHLDSMEALEKAAQTQGVSYEDFKASIRNSIITQEVVKQEVSRHVSMNESDVRQYFKNHESEFAQPESVHLSEILIPTPTDDKGGAPDASQISAAQAKADAIEAKLQAGATFADLAKTNSGGSTAAQGGELGEFHRDQLAPILEEKTFSLKAGQFTEPIRTKQGFIILQVTQHNAGGDAGFQEVEPQVQEALFMERMQPALRQYLTKLREEAYIEIKPGYEDSGASPNEMRITNSAYVPPGPKKKKKFQRTRFRGRSHHAKRAGVMVATDTAANNRKTEVASQGVQKPGKKEKIRYGQAPREALPPSGQPAAGAAAGDSQVAVVTNPTSNAQPDLGSVGTEPEAAPQGKTRYSARPRVHKTKKDKAAEAAANKPTPPTPEELASQKIQNAPLDLSEQPAKKKKKVKGEKTRYSARPKVPEKTPQPYMGNQPPADNTQPANGSQSKSDDSQTAPKN